VEILSRLGQQGDRGSRIDKITDLDHMLPLALRALFRRNRPNIFEIHLDLFQWLSQLVGMGRLFGTCHQAARGVQDLPDRSTGAGQRDVCGLQLRVTGKIVE